MTRSPARWRQRLSLLLLAFSLGACATHPLGEDWDRLNGPARTARALEVLESLIAGGVDGTGRSFTDREVLSVDPNEVSYIAEDDPHARPSRLAWSAIKSVDSEPLTTYPSRPETLFVHLEEARARGVRDKVTPALAHAGLATPYLLLPSRPRWSRSRMVLALQHLRSSTAPLPSSTAVAPVRSHSRTQPATHLDEVERKLERLKEWKERGLISEEDYAAKRRALLQGL